MAREVELEVLPAAQAYRLGIISWSPLNGGLLSGVLRKRAEGSAARSADSDADAALEVHRSAIEAYEKLCAELGHDPADVALAWLLSRPGVSAPIVGSRTAEQLAGSLRALSITLDEATLAALDGLFPPVGKGGPGPEAWAW